MYVGNAQSQPNLLLNNAELAVVVEMKDLALTVHTSLTFEAHIRQTVSQAFVRPNLTHKCFVSREFLSLRAFKVYVKPIVEYASTYRVNQEKLFESVQKKFTERLLCMA